MSDVGAKAVYGTVTVTGGARLASMENVVSSVLATMRSNTARTMLRGQAAASDERVQRLMRNWRLTPE